MNSSFHSWDLGVLWNQDWLSGCSTTETLRSTQLRLGSGRDIYMYIEVPCSGNTLLSISCERRGDSVGRGGDEVGDFHGNGVRPHTSLKCPSSFDADDLIVFQFEIKVKAGSTTRSV